MSDTVVNNLVLVAVTAASLWWSIGGRDRRTLGAMRDRLELKQLLPEDSPLASRLQVEADARGAAYLRAGLWTRITWYLLLVFGSAACVTYWAHWWRDQSGRDSLALGVAVGSLLGAIYSTAVTMITVRSSRRTIQRAQKIVGHR